MQLDKTDKKILQILYSDGRASIKSIAEQTFISAPTVAARIENLRKIGVISGFYADINPESFGSVVRAYVEMSVDPEKREMLFSHLKSVPQVLKCCRITGEHSLLIEVIFRNIEELDNFTIDLQHYGTTKTQIIFSTIIEHRPFI